MANRTQPTVFSQEIFKNRTIDLERFNLKENLFYLVANLVTKDGTNQIPVKYGRVLFGNNDGHEFESRFCTHEELSEMVPNLDTS